MGLLQKLKSALGLDGTRSPDAGTTSPGDVDVTVEREPSAESEDAVKGTETASAGTETAEESSDDLSESEPVVEEAETAETSVDEGDEPAGSDEPPETETSAESAAATESEESPPGSTDDVTEISGIGPAYGQRLSDAGVDTVAELADADADELATETDISANRIEGWIEAAAEY